MIREVYKNRIRSFEILDDEGNVIVETFGDVFSARDKARDLGVSTKEAAATGSAPVAPRPTLRQQEEARACVGRGLRVSRDRDESLPGSAVGVVSEPVVRKPEEFETDQYGNVLDGSDDEYSPVKELVHYGVYRRDSNVAIMVMGDDGSPELYSVVDWFSHEPPQWIGDECDGWEYVGFDYDHGGNDRLFIEKILPLCDGWDRNWLEEYLDR